MDGDTKLPDILVVEDFAPFREVIRKSLHKALPLATIHEAADGWEAVEKAKELRPTLVLLDIGLPGLSGLEVAKHIHGLSPDIRILFVSGQTSADVVQATVRLGAAGYVHKGSVSKDLIPAVEAVLLGKRFIGSSIGPDAASFSQRT